MAQLLVFGEGTVAFNECKQAIPLLENINATAVLAEKGYDTNVLLEWLESTGNNKSNRIEEIECDYWHYKERHADECLFGKLKHSTAELSLVMRKMAINYMGMLSFASMLLWLR